MSGRAPARQPGQPDEITLLELAETVLGVTGSRARSFFEALPVDDPQVRQPTSPRVPGSLGWEPEASKTGCAFLIAAASRTPVGQSLLREQLLERGRRRRQARSTE